MPEDSSQVGWHLDFLLVNLRLAGTALSGNEYILPAYFLPTEIIDDTKKEITLRVHIGQMIRNKSPFPFKKGSHLYFSYLPEVNSDENIYLKEIILLAQNHQNYLLLNILKIMKRGT